MLTQYCIACHSEKAKAAGMDSARKLAHIRAQKTLWANTVKALTPTSPKGNRKAK